MTSQLHEPPALLTPAEAAALLRVSRTTLWRLGREGRLRVRRLSSRNFRYLRADVEALIAGDDHNTKEST